MTPNNSDQAALLPCPWCGESLGQPVTVSEGSTFRWRKVDGCCTDGPEIRHNTMADDQAAAEVESHAEAVAAWNRRAGAQAAMHDELRALNIFYGGERRLCVQYNREPTTDEMHAALAALSLPASEAVARTKAGQQWHDWQETLHRLISDRTEKLHFAADVQADESGVRFDNCRFIRAEPVGYISFGKYRESCEATDDEKRRWQPVWTSKPPTHPAPAAHAGGEAIPVDALLALIPEPAECVSVGNYVGRVGDRRVAAVWDNCRAEMQRRITALLSGGAAREGE